MLELHLLGNPYVRTTSAQTPLRHREAAVLAYLAEHNRSYHLTRDVIASKFWPYSGTSRSLRSLSQLIHQIRGKIPELQLSSNSNMLTHAAITTDVQRFRQLVKGGDYLEALSLYTGNFLQGRGVGSPDVDVWIDAVQAELNMLLDRALQHCAIGGTTNEEHNAVTALAEALLVRGEGSFGSLLAMTLTSIRAGDVRKAEHYYHTLQDEYPDRAPTFPELHGIAVAPVSKDDDALARRTLRFVGRTQELRTLEDCWTTVKAGSGQVVLITGEPGIGKTRLATQFLRRVAIYGGRVWAARCLSATKRVPYVTWQELWKQIAQFECAVSKEQAAFESLRRVLHSPKEASAAPEYTLQHHLDAFFSVVKEVAAAHPLALFIDDVQWADVFTAQLLTLSALRFFDSPVLVLLAARTEDAEPLPDWIRNELSTSCTVNVGQLSVDSTSALVRSFEETSKCVLDEQIKNRVVWQAAGRPLLLLEGLAAAAEKADSDRPSGNYLPSTAEALLTPRFRGLTKDENWLCGLLAVLDRPQWIHGLAEQSELRDSIVAGALDTLSARGIVHFCEGKVSFSHDLMREAAYRQLSPPTRTLLHKRAASVLVTEHDEGLIAHHYANAGDAAKAGHHALKAAETARQAGLLSDCEYYYQLALNAGAEEHRLEAAHRYAMHLIHVGRLADIEALRPYLSCGQVGTDSDALMPLVEFESAFSTGNLPLRELVSRARDLVGLAQSDANANQLTLVIGTLFDIALDSANMSFGNEVAIMIENALERSSDPVLINQLRAFLALWEASTASLERALTLLPDEVLEDAKPDQVHLITTFVRGVIYLWSGDLREAKELLARCLSSAATAGDVRRLNACAVNLGLVLLEMGEFEAARNKLESVLSSPNFAHRLRAYANLAILYYEHGSHAQALSTIHTIQRANQSYVSENVSNTAAAVAGLIALRNGNAATVRHLYEQVRYTSSTVVSGDTNYTIPFLARVLAQRGMIRDAIGILDESMSRCAKRDLLCSLRLQTAKADLMRGCDSDVAFVLARDVKLRAMSCGAALITRDADVVVEATRY